MIRLTPQHSNRIERSNLVSFSFEGEQYQGHAGETVVSALLRAGVQTLRAAPNDSAPRGAFCCMGLCQECAVVVDGQVVEACRTEVIQDLVVERI